MSKRDTRDNILEKQFHLLAYRRRLVIINIESGNGGHAMECMCMSIARLHASASDAISFEFISGQYLQGYIVYLASF